MSVSFRKSLCALLVVFFIAASVGCVGNSQGPPSIKVEVPRVLPAKKSVSPVRPFPAIPVCEAPFKKLCEAYHEIRVRYLHPLSHEELSKIFAAGAERAYGKPSPFFRLKEGACSKEEEAVCSLLASYKRSRPNLSNASLTNGMIRAAVKELGLRFDDPYSRYASNGESLWPKRWNGIGVIFSEKATSEGGFFIRRVVQGSPAERAGIKRGDIVIKVGGISLKGKDIKFASSHIRGKNGTSVRITLASSCKGKERTVLVPRSPIGEPGSGVMKRIGGIFGYVRLDDFEHDEWKTLKKTAADIERTGGPIRGIVLDLRDNPGGSVKQSVDLLSLFTKGGTALFETNQEGREFPWLLNTEFRPIFPDIPVVVLVNGDSASASELVSGAFQAFKRGVILGEKTFGKGVMQSTYFLRDGSRLYLTMGYTFTPDHRKLHKEGVTPDVMVSEGENELCTGDLQLRAALELLQGVK